MLNLFPLESPRLFVAFMKKIIVAVGSIRKPKLRAVTEALKAFAPKLVPDGDFEVVGLEVGSGVSSTPSSCEELMRGARQRVEALMQVARETRKPWRYFVGLEGGLEVLQDDRSRRVFLEFQENTPASVILQYLETALQAHEVAPRLASFACHLHERFDALAGSAHQLFAGGRRGAYAAPNFQAHHFEIAVWNKFRRKGFQSFRNRSELWFANAANGNDDLLHESNKETRRF